MCATRFTWSNSLDVAPVARTHKPLLRCVSASAIQLLHIRCQLNAGTPAPSSQLLHPLYLIFNCPSSSTPNAGTPSPPSSRLCISCLLAPICWIRSKHFFFICPCRYSKSAFFSAMIGPVGIAALFRCAPLFMHDAFEHAHVVHATRVRACAGAWTVAGAVRALPCLNGTSTNPCRFCSLMLFRFGSR